jgi:MFS family permease
LLSVASTPETRGRIFGLHRGMDTLGAVTGPLLALLYLWYRPGDYRMLFILAFAPGLLSVAFTLLVKEPSNRKIAKRPPLPGFWGYWRGSPAAYRAVTGGLLVFALANSSDALLLLRMKSEGLSDQALILVYTGFNLVFAAFAYPLGQLSDRLGPKRVIQFGIVLFALVYGGFAFDGNVWWFGALFFLYGLYMAATDGVSKAWISTICPPEQTGTAIGVFAGLQSIAILLASTLAGLLWNWGGAFFPFAFSAVLSFGGWLYFLRSRSKALEVAGN